MKPALDFLGDNMKVRLVFGRYVPGLRFVINSTMGLSETPYFTFLPWSAIGGVLCAHASAAVPARRRERVSRPVRPLARLPPST